MDFPPDLEPHYIQVMMSVPYNLNSFSPYLAVGVTTSFLNTTDLFNTFYYYSGPFDRQNAGTLAEYTSETNKGNGNWLLVFGRLDQDPGSFQ